MTARIWGAHAARVLVSAPSPKQSSCREMRWLPKKKKKFATVVNRNGPVSSRARIAEPYPHPAAQTRWTP